jgi:hypothetical protein
MAILTGRKFDFRVVDIGVPTICHLQFNDLFVEALYILPVAGSFCDYFHLSDEMISLSLFMLVICDVELRGMCICTERFGHTF